MRERGNERITKGQGIKPHRRRDQGRRQRGCLGKEKGLISREDDPNIEDRRTQTKAITRARNASSMKEEGENREIFQELSQQKKKGRK